MTIYLHEEQFKKVIEADKASIPYAYIEKFRQRCKKFKQTHYIKEVSIDELS